jgi:hypothetical protein
MDWLNLHIPTVLRSPEYIGSDPIDRSTWLQLLTYCATLENGGIIRGAAAWKDRKWQQLCAVTREETRRPSDLWTWEGDDIHVKFYPIDKETEIRRKRLIAQENGNRSGGRPRKPNPNQPETNVGYSQKPTSVISPKAEGEGERKEKGNSPPNPLTGEQERNERSFESSSIPDIVALYPRKERTAEACEALHRHLKAGIDPEAVTAGTRAIAAVIPRLAGGHLNKFVPSALVFFRDRRWEDDPATWLRNAPAHANGAPSTGTLDLGGRREAQVIKLSTH